LFEGPEKDEALRLTLRVRSSDDLFRELRDVDPKAAQRIHPNDRLRVIRALEVYRTTGKPMSLWQAEAKPLPVDFHVIGLYRERAQHRLLIEQRIHAMLACGLIEEIEHLRSKGLTPHVQAYRTIGVPEACDVLDGKMSVDDFVPLVAARTWQLVRRQMAWFRRDKNVQWIDVTHNTVENVAKQILSSEFERNVPAKD